MTHPFCNGSECPLTHHCMRFKADIDIKKDVHFSFPPYNHEKGKCAFFSDGNPDSLLRKVNDFIASHSPPVADD